MLGTKSFASSITRRPRKSLPGGPGILPDPREERHRELVEEMLLRLQARQADEVDDRNPRLRRRRLVAEQGRRVHRRAGRSAARGFVSNATRRASAASLARSLASFETPMPRARGASSSSRAMRALEVARPARIGEGNGAPPSRCRACGFGIFRRISRAPPHSFNAIQSSSRRPTGTPPDRPRRRAGPADGSNAPAGCPTPCRASTGHDVRRPRDIGRPCDHPRASTTPGEPGPPFVERRQVVGAIDDDRGDAQQGDFLDQPLQEHRLPRPGPRQHERSAFPAT